VKSNIKIIIFLVAILHFHIANASVLSEIPTISKKIAGLFKKTADDIPASGNANLHLNDPNKLSPVNMNEVGKPLNDVPPLTANAVTLQTVKCVSRKLSTDPMMSNQEAHEFCKRAFYSCVAEHKNNFGFNDSKCLSVVNEGRPYGTYEPYSLGK
jgi:hypothetical protein